MRDRASRDRGDRERRRPARRVGRATGGNRAVGRGRATVDGRRDRVPLVSVGGGVRTDGMGVQRLRFRAPEPRCASRRRCARDERWHRARGGSCAAR